MSKFDIAIVGGGPGGYVAAIRAAQYGKKVCLVEKAELGGVCLNWGCIPSKSLIANATRLKEAKRLLSFGVQMDWSTMDYHAVQKESRSAAKRLRSGVEGLLRKNGVAVFLGTAELLSPSLIQVRQDDGAVSGLDAKNIIVATGSTPREFPGATFDEEFILSSSGALGITRLPKSMAIIGGGAVGCEFAYIFSAFGVHVELLESAGQLLPSMDAEAAAVLAGSLKNMGVQVQCGIRVSNVLRNNQGVSMDIEAGGNSRAAQFDCVLAAIGRLPNTSGLGLEAAGVKIAPTGHIVVDEFCQSSQTGIFAIGDVVDTPALAHVAMRQAALAVDRICGFPAQPLDKSLIPNVVYTEPEVASFGPSEADLVPQGVEFMRSTFPFLGNGKAVAVAAPEGFVRLLVEKHTGELLSAVVVGGRASELIHELLLARHGELLIEDIQTLMHAHPTFSEAIMEGAQGVFGKAVHM